MILNDKQLISIARQQIVEVSCAQLYLKLAEKPIIIDIREKDELRMGILPGAIHIPRGQLEMRISSILQVTNDDNPLALLATKNIYLYCRSGGRSALAAQTLLNMGFIHVFSLLGGSDGWGRAGYELACEPNK